ncbi:MAG: hypothetical protein HYU75_00085 [Betaproteobacteria bacterium]|nr:hypothetical protein [Betaproteobacteria bacterium]
MPASFEDQLVIVDELLHEVERMARVEKRASSRRSLPAYERELRLAGLAQRIAQAYTMIEGVLAYIARRIDRAPVTGEEWHKQLISRCSRSFNDPSRPAVISAALGEELLELCEFRHVVRNIYPTRLDESKVRENLERLIRAAPAFGAACSAYAASHSPAREARRRKRTKQG